MLKYIVGHPFLLATLIIYNLDHRHENHKKKTKILQCVTISYASHNLTGEIAFSLEQRKYLVRLISNNSLPRIVKDIELH